MENLRHTDPAIARAIEQERQRQENTLELIAASQAVSDATAEPAKRKRRKRSEP